MVKIDFECELQTFYSLSSQGVVPLISQVEVDLGREDGTVDLALGLWDSDDFTTPLAEDAVIEIPENLYVAAIAQNAGNLNTILDNCWATPSSDPLDVSRYEF